MTGTRDVSTASAAPAPVRPRRPHWLLTPSSWSPLQRWGVTALGLVLALGATFLLDPYRNYLLAVGTAYLCAIAGLSLLVGRGPFDVIVDAVARRSIFAYRRALAPGGRALVVGGTTRAVLRMLTVGSLLGRVSGARLGVLIVHQGPAAFLPIAEQVARGELTVPIDGVYPLEELPQAITRHGEGRANGKVVVAVRGDPSA